MSPSPEPNASAQGTAPSARPERPGITTPLAKVLGVVVFQWLVVSCGTGDSTGGVAVFALCVPLTIVALAWWYARSGRALVGVALPVAALPSGLLVWFSAALARREHLFPNTDLDGSLGLHCGLLWVLMVAAIASGGLGALVTNSLVRGRGWAKGALRVATWLGVGAAIGVACAAAVHCERAQASIPHVDPAAVPVVAVLPLIFFDDWDSHQTDHLPGEVLMERVRHYPTGECVFALGPSRAAPYGTFGPAPSRVPLHDYNCHLPLVVRRDPLHDLWIVQQDGEGDHVLRASDFGELPATPVAWFIAAGVAIAASLLGFAWSVRYTRACLQRLAQWREGTLNAKGWVSFADGTPSIQLGAPSNLRPGPVLVRAASLVSPFRDNVRATAAEVQPGTLAELRARLRLTQLGVCTCALAVSTIGVAPLVAVLMGQ